MKATGRILRVWAKNQLGYEIFKKLVNFLSLIGKLIFDFVLQFSRVKSAVCELFAFYFSLCRIVGLENFPAGVEFRWFGGRPPTRSPV